MGLFSVFDQVDASRDWRLHRRLYCDLITERLFPVTAPRSCHCRAGRRRYDMFPRTLSLSHVTAWMVLWLVPIASSLSSAGYRD